MTVQADQETTTDQAQRQLCNQQAAKIKFADHFTLA